MRVMRENASNQIEWLTPDIPVVCSFLVDQCTSGKSVGFLLYYADACPIGLKTELKDTLAPFGFTCAPPEDCDILLVLYANHQGYSRFIYQNQPDLLDFFEETKARKMFLFLTPGAIREEFWERILNIDRNWLDRSVLLPNFAKIPSPRLGEAKLHGTQILYVLDKNRILEKRNDVTVIDSSDFGDCDDDELNFSKLNDLCDAMRRGSCDEVRKIIRSEFDRGFTASKDFRDIYIRKEPVYPTFHVLHLRNSQYNLLKDIAEIKRVPSFSRYLLRTSQLENEGNETVKVKTFSPKYYAPFGYSMPSNPEEKVYLKKRILPEHWLCSNDILLVAQGNIGKICIVDPEFKQKTWLPTSSTIIIRTKDLLFTPQKLLYMYLSSESVRCYLTSCARASGTVLSLVDNDLQSLPVPVFTPKEINAMLDAFNRLSEIAGSIQDLQKEAKSIMHRFYHT